VFELQESLKKNLFLYILIDLSVFIYLYIYLWEKNTGQINLILSIYVISLCQESKRCENVRERNCVENTYTNIIQLRKYHIE